MAKLLTNIKQAVGNYLVNIPGWRTNRKIVVFESDDWGSIRMPSTEVYELLLAKGITGDHSIYDKFDTLEEREDLELLLNILSEFTNEKGNFPIFTFNTVLGNPDFDRIQADLFEHYYHEDLFSSYQRYHGISMTDLWEDAISSMLIRPQFHAREHLNVSLWMKALQLNHKQTKAAFEYQYYGLKTDTPSGVQKNYLAAYWAEDIEDLRGKQKILGEGLALFRQIFGFASESFVACNFIYPDLMERSLSAEGIKYIQTQRGHFSPNITEGSDRIKRHFTGQVNGFNQRFLVRNCYFEPTLDLNGDSVSSCLRDIEMAFSWKKPAIISSHRINYVGGLSKKNRDQGLKMLHQLIGSILKKWPEVEFISSDTLGKQIGGANENCNSSQEKQFQQ